MLSSSETGATGVATADATGAANLTPSLAVEAEGLVRAFGGKRAVDGVSLTLAEGDCLALFGPNGAGKTTLLRLLGGLLKPTKGTTKLHGVPLPGPAETRRLVGLISHHSMLYPALTVRENVRFAAECQGCCMPTTPRPPCSAGFGCSTVPTSRCAFSVAACSSG